MSKKVTIIIPVFNAESFIDNCISNVLNQTYKNYEVVIVDDGSVDNTKDIILKKEKANKAIKCINNLRKGVSSARNCGIDNSNGEYIVFLDVDDYISPFYLETLVTMLEVNKSDCAAVSYATDINKISNELNNEIDILDVSNKKYELLVNSKYSVGGYVWNKIYKKSVIDKYNIRFDEDISVGEDLLFNFNYFEKAKSVSFKKICLYHYVLNINSAVNNLKNEKWFDAIEVYSKLLKMNLSDEINNYYRFLYSQVIMEAIYRLKYCVNAPYSKEELNKLKLQYVKLSRNFSLSQNIKIVLFKYFPNIVMKYKRKSIKWN